MHSVCEEFNDVFYAIQFLYLPIYTYLSDLHNYAFLRVGIEVKILNIKSNVTLALSKMSLQHLSGPWTARSLSSRSAICTSGDRTVCNNYFCKCKKL